jgi:transposase
VSRVLRRGPRGVKINHAEDHAKLSDPYLSQRCSAPFAGSLVRRLPEVEKEPPSLSYRAPPVGVDLGLKHLATLSTGEKIDNPKHYQARLRYLRQQQRCLAPRQSGSRRREKQKLRVARAHAKVRQARQYALHDLTTRLTQDYDLIFIEDQVLAEEARSGQCTRACLEQASLH